MALVTSRLIFRADSVWRCAVMLGLMLCLSSPAADEEGKFLFLTLRFKDGVVTVVKSTLVNGTLKPQRDSKKTDAFHISLGKTEGESIWSVAIDDPSVCRYEYEDPQAPGTIRVKEVKLDDVEFIVRVPLIDGVRQLEVYRHESPASGAKQPTTPVKKLLLQHKLPQEVTR